MLWEPPAPGPLCARRWRWSVVTPEAFDLLAEPALDMQFGSRLDTLLRMHSDSLDGPVGPVIVASTDPVWRGRVASCWHATDMPL